MAYAGSLGRILEVQRSGVHARLTRTGLSAEMAERWLDAWTLEALGRGLTKDGAYWLAGWDWIAEQRAAGRPAWYS